MRNDGRASDQLRPIKVTRKFTETPAGSVLWEQGKTIVLCTASISQDLPPWMKDDRPGGWITAEYVMLPASTPQRKGWPKIGHTDSRGTEIQRLIGRSLRAVVDLDRLGEQTITLDCDVLQADGGTRTASITGAYVALADAMNALQRRRQLSSSPLHGQVAAISVGIVRGEAVVDLDYLEDSSAETDMNVVMNNGGGFVEVQGTAEGHAFRRHELDRLLDLAAGACDRLFAMQSEALQAPLAPAAPTRA
jgi:ribonuclease PH